MDVCPPHFETITFDLRVNEKIISDWIYEYTEGRFFLGTIVNHNPLPKPDVFDKRNGKMASFVRPNEMSECAGFEIHSEASYFGLMLSTFNKSDFM
jgi:hypothetical protein